MDFLKVTIYAAGPTRKLAKSLAAITDGATVVRARGYWQGQSERSRMITVLTAEPLEAILVFQQTEEWLHQSGQDALLIETALVTGSELRSNH